MTKFEISIPVLNEEDSIESKLKELLEFIKTSLDGLANFTVVVADNGSTDETSHIVKRMVSEYSNLAYLHVDRPGVGRALKAAWGQSTADVIGYMDLDLATDLNHIRDVCVEILSHDYDMVIGNRLDHKSQVLGRSLKREITSRIFNKIVQLFVESRVLDGMCGFKFMKRKFATQVLKAASLSDNWIFSTQLLCVAFRIGGRIKYIPIKWTDDNSTKVKIFKLARQYLMELYLFKRELKKIV